MDVNTIINMLDSKMVNGVSRIKVVVDEEDEKNTMKEEYHLGRCDIGSPWADGSVGNCD